MQKQSWTAASLISAQINSVAKPAAPQPVPVPQTALPLIGGLPVVGQVSSFAEDVRALIGSKMIELSPHYSGMKSSDPKSFDRIVNLVFRHYGGTLKGAVPAQAALDEVRPLAEALRSHIGVAASVAAAVSGQVSAINTAQPAPSASPAAAHLALLPGGWLLNRKPTSPAEELTVRGWTVIRHGEHEGREMVVLQSTNGKGRTYTAVRHLLKRSSFSEKTYNVDGAQVTGFSGSYFSDVLVSADNLDTTEAACRLLRS